MSNSPEGQTACHIHHMISTPTQELYDAFNMLMFSKNTLVIQKLITKVNIYKNVQHLYGDILEFGVFKGASLALWLQLKKMYEPNSQTNIIGFDFFNCDDTLISLNGNLTNKLLMEQVLSRAAVSTDTNIDVIQKKCDNILDKSTILIKGDASHTSKEFNNNNPGARIKLLYLDMDVAEPTYNVLKHLWNKVVIGGQVVLDEYGHHKWDESDGVDKFLSEIPGKYKLICTNVVSPTLIISKLE